MNFASSKYEIDIEEFVAEQKYPTFIEGNWISDDSDENTCDDAEPILEQVIETPVVERKIKKKQQRPSIRIPVTNPTRKGKGKRKSACASCDEGECPLGIEHGFKTPKKSMKKGRVDNEKHARKRVGRPKKTQNKKNVKPKSDPISEDCDWITKQLQDGVVGSVQQVVNKIKRNLAARFARRKKNQDKRINKRVREAVASLKKENKRLTKENKKLETALKQQKANLRALYKKQLGKNVNKLEAKRRSSERAASGNGY